ncbi:GNAT family N-acetyltransferase [Tunturibacter psychrotolerans]|uniref:GNAT family N-acetyltransferase n=1 Tax=Tunturiibacter psychrotolerans TaxID=3069686 RepID=A0AAU7ZLI0_9BACT
MKIIRATPSQRIEAELLLNEYYEAVDVMKRDTPAAIAGYLSDESSGLWIAFVNELPAGCVVLRPLPTIEAATECKRLYVRPQFRGRGIAEALLDAMEEYALEKAANWVYLDSKDDLKDALRIYVRRGYQPCARYNDNPQATVFLRKSLRSAAD